jgi:NADP-dependent 3-hydroxy acid dehydrogenase YdfG
MKNVIVITGASSGFGALTARALAKTGHTVYASMRDTTGRNASHVEAAKQFSQENNVDLRTVVLDVSCPRNRPMLLSNRSSKRMAVSMS